MKISGIYKIGNTVNGKVYIGSSVNITQRIKCHKSYLINNKHQNIHLQRAFNLDKIYFIFEIVEKCSKDDLAKREQYWIDILKPCGLYNIITEVERLKFPDSSKEKMSKTRIYREVAKGKNNPMYGTHRAGKDNPNYGNHKLAGKNNPRYLDIDNNIQNEICASYKGGVSIERLQIKYKISKAPIKRILKENNIKLRNLRESFKLKVRVECPYCHKTLDASNYGRHHKNQQCQMSHI